MRFENKTVIVTGAGSGMGRSAALGFAREGAAVFVTDINKTTLEQTVREIRSCDGKVSAIAGDVTRIKVVKKVVGEALGIIRPNRCSV